MKSLIIYFGFFVFAVYGNPAPCHLDDEACITNAFQTIYSDVVVGIPSLGIETSDPLKQALVTAQLPKLNYTFIDGKVTGMKDCKVEYARFTSSDSKFEFKLSCPLVQLTADYEVQGEILLLKLQGKGKCTITSDKYELTFVTDIENTKDANNKKHIKMKNFTVDYNIKGKIVYNFTNLFNGDEKLSQAFHKTANENWKVISKETHGPGTYKYFKSIVDNLNKYFENLPFEQIFAKTS